MWAADALFLCGIWASCLSSWSSVTTQTTGSLQWCRFQCRRHHSVWTLLASLLFPCWSRHNAAGRLLQQHRWVEHIWATWERVDICGNEAVLSLYPELELRDLEPQLQMFWPPWKVCYLEWHKWMIPEVRAEYSQVCKLIRLLLVSPAASAQCSSLTGHVAAYVDDRINSMAICIVHPLMLDSLCLKPLMKEFIAWSNLVKLLDLCVSGVVGSVGMQHSAFGCYAVIDQSCRVNCIRLWTSFFRFVMDYDLFLNTALALFQPVNH